MLFNLSFRSHDGFEEDEKGYLRPAVDKYADQRKVFDDLGGGVLKNAIEGKLQQVKSRRVTTKLFYTVYCFAQR